MPSTADSNADLAELQVLRMIRDAGKLSPEGKRRLRLLEKRVASPSREVS